MTRTSEIDSGATWSTRSRPPSARALGGHLDHGRQRRPVRHATRREPSRDRRRRFGHTPCMPRRPASARRAAASRAGVAAQLERASGQLATSAITQMEQTLPWYARAAGGHPVGRRAGRPGRHRGVHRVVPEPRRGADDHRRRVRVGSARGGPRGDAAPGGGDGPVDRRRGRAVRRRDRRTTTSGRCCARRCCATRARSRSRQPRSTPRRPRPAARGTRGWSRSWSTASCAARTTTRCARGRPRSAGDRTAWSRSRSARRRSAIPSRTPSACAATPGSRTSTSSPARTVIVCWRSSAAARTRSQYWPRWPTRSARGRSWSARSSTASPRPAGRRARRSPASGRPRPGRTRRARSPPTTCCPERALAGDPVARRQLVDEVYAPLAAVPAVLDTVTTYLEQALSVEATARALFVHPNTVRYRLRRAAELAGHVPTDAARRLHAAHGGRARSAGRCAAQLSVRRRDADSDEIDRRERASCRVLHNESGRTWSASCPP